MTTPSLPDAARTEAVLFVLKGAVVDAYDASRATTQAGLDKLADELGVNSVTVTVAGVDVAKISLTKSKPKAVVTSDVALLAWVEEHYPEAVIRTVNPEWQKRLLEAASAAGEPVDTSTGEVIPGVAMVGGKAGHRVTMAKTGKAVIGDAWRRGELSDVVTRALMPGGD